MKVALVKLIWKSADLSSALPDPDSCMEMRSLYRRTLFCGESMQALLFFSPSKKKKKWGAVAGRSQPEGMEI